jgi:hypothetical protein
VSDTEKQITNKILKHLRSVPYSKWSKIHQGGMSEKGVPDIVGCFQGRYVAIEVKRPGKHPTPMQADYLQGIKAAGGVAWCVHSVSELLDLMTGLALDEEGEEDLDTPLPG